MLLQACVGEMHFLGFFKLYALLLLVRLQRPLQPFDLFVQLLFQALGRLQLQLDGFLIVPDLPKTRFQSLLLRLIRPAAL